MLSFDTSSYRLDLEKTYSSCEPPLNVLQWVTDFADLMMDLTNHVAPQWDIFIAKLKDSICYIIAATQLVSAGPK